MCELLHRRGVAGATVLLGFDGTGHGERRRARFFGANADVPTMIIAVGSGERIGRVLPELGALLRRPLVTLERVRVCKRDGALVERPHALPGTDAHGMPLWQKPMIFTYPCKLGTPSVSRSARLAIKNQNGVAHGRTDRSAKVIGYRSKSNVVTRTHDAQNPKH